jgi:hypothetical protein
VNVVIHDSSGPQISLFLRPKENPQPGEEKLGQGSLPIAAAKPTKPSLLDNLWPQIFTEFFPSQGLSIKRKKRKNDPSLQSLFP